MHAQARHGQLNAMGWFGNVGIASPANPADMQPGSDALLSSTSSSLLQSYPILVMLHSHPSWTILLGLPCFSHTLSWSCCIALFWLYALWIIDCSDPICYLSIQNQYRIQQHSRRMHSAPSYWSYHFAFPPTPSLYLWSTLPD